ncbi:MAG: hypothetical protein HY651_12080 [Acidobacteria bacterium]|nr:hypothetical protein [Acidobacteriota bacterium]
MGVSIGAINVVNQAVETEFRLGVIERVVDILVERTRAQILPEELGAIRVDILANLQQKYPGLGLKF